MSIHIILKFPPINPIDEKLDAIEQHAEVLEKKGSVWWGKFGKGISDQKYMTVKRQIDKSIPTYIYLCQGGKLRYRARLIDLFKKMGGASVKTNCPELNLVPSYYRKDKLNVWFKFGELTPLDSKFDINDNYKKLDNSKISIKGHPAVIYIQQKTK